MGYCLCGFASVARGHTLLVEVRSGEPPWQGAVAVTAVAERAPSTPGLEAGPARDPAMAQATPKDARVPRFVEALPLKAPPSVNLAVLPVKPPPAVLQQKRAVGRTV